MKIQQVTENKKRFLPLLLLGDEQESMIDHYLESGDLYVWFDGEEAIAVCVVAEAGPDICEIKNLAVVPHRQRQGIGRQVIGFVCRKYGGYRTLTVGTGDSLLTVPFYEKCGFRESHRAPNFFTENYDHPIFEGGKQLIDMVYLSMKLKRGSFTMTKHEAMVALRNHPDIHYNCAQSVLIPFAEDMGVTLEQANALALNFGGGMGCGSVCGAITGALMAMGGLGLPVEQRQELLKQFRARNGAIDCAALLKAAAERGETKKEHCDRMVAECLNFVCELTEKE